MSVHSTARAPQVVGLTVFAVAASLWCEGLTRGSSALLWGWLTLHPLAAALNAGCAVALCFVVWAVVGRLGTAMLLGLALVLLVGLAHKATMSALGRPLFPWDLFLYREAWDVLRHATVRLGVAPLAVGGFAVALALAASLRYGPRAPGWRSRLALAAGGCLVLLGLSGMPGRILRPLGVRSIFWDQLENYRQNGVLLAFLMNFPAANVQRPPSYSPEAVRAAAARGTPHLIRADTPDIVVVMSESLFDPTRVPGLSFAKDPLPNLHRLQHEAASGRLYSPVFGGGTANTEFEVLTGHTTRFLPPGSVPYQQYVRRKQQSLASIFQARGYRTEAVHMYHRWFWERERVYGYLGFERFISMENVDLAGSTGWYPEDSFLTREIVRALEAAVQPLFLFAVSVEAHGPYEPSRFPNSTVKVEGPLDDDARAELITYVEAISHADRELGELVRYLERRGRPTVLVFFGDHLPSLPRVLAQTGLVESVAAIDSLDIARRSFLYEVPLVLWNNLKPGPRALGALSPSFLGPLLLEEIGIPGTPYMDFLNTVRKQLPVVSPHLLCDADGTLYDEMPDRLRGLEGDWWTLEYDALFGDDLLARDPG